MSKNKIKDGIHFFGFEKHDFDPPPKSSFSFFLAQIKQNKSQTRMNLHNYKILFYKNKK